MGVAGGYFFAYLIEMRGPDLRTMREIVMNDKCFEGFTGILRITYV